MQATLFGRGEPALRRVGFVKADLGSGAWVAHLPGLMAGQDTLFERLRASTEWHAQERQMYDRVVAVPRLLGRPADGVLGLLAPVQALMLQETGWELDSVSLALYRDGQDSVAFHGDKMGALRGDCVIAVLSLGSARTFLMRPAGGGASRSVRVAGGDLLVMGGTAQQTWEHAVPKAVGVGPRLAVMFRPSRAPLRVVEGERG